MFQFINYLRFIATVLITNSHFGEIWPISALATGGLLGNIIFLAVSGFLLYNIKLNFPKWFLKRFLRVYPVMAIFTLIVSLCGFYSLKSISDAIRLFIYPTNYIFIVWLILCYCLFYLIAYADKKINNFLEISMGVLFGLWVLTYVVFCDKSAYTVDNVSEPFILFLYMESMLLGALFKKHSGKLGVFKLYKPFATAIALVLYFGSKIAISKVSALLGVQIFNQFIIFATLYCVFDLFMCAESLFHKLPFIGGVITHISNITLQIYIVQFVIINRLHSLVFPLNLVAVTVCIVAAASLLYYVELFIRKGISCLIAKKASNGKEIADAENSN